MAADRLEVDRYLRRTAASNDGERHRLLMQGRAVVVDRGDIAVDVPFGQLTPWERDELLDVMRIHSVLRKNPHAVAARTCAVVLHGLWTRGPLSQLDLASAGPSGNGSRAMPGLDGRPALGPTVRRRRVQDLHGDAVTTVDGLAVTSLRRTVRDCLLHEPASTAILAAISAARLHAEVRDRWDVPRLRTARRFLDQVREDLQALPRGYRGTRRALVLLAAADPAIESPGEALTLVFARAIGLPQPEAQAHFCVDGKDYYGDLWFEGFGLLGEYDGIQKYGSGDDVFAEKVREDALRSLPQVRSVLRVIAPDLAAAPARRRLASRILDPLSGAERRLLVPAPDFGTPW